MRSLKDKRVIDILNENKKIPHIEDKETGHPIRTGVSGFVSGIATTPTDVLGLVQGVGELPINLTKALFSDKYSAGDAVSDAFVDNKLLQTSGKIDDSINEFFGSPKFEDMSGNDQLSYMSGQLMPIVGAKNLATNTVKKLFKKFAKNAKIKGAKKGLSGKELKDFAKKDAKKKAGIANFTADMLLPGIQLDKKASLGKNLVSGGLQAGIPLAMNEGFRYTADQEGIFGDYRENTPETIGLISDRRKARPNKLLSELPENVYFEETLDQDKEDSSTVSDILKGTAAVGAAVLGTSYATRKLRSLFGKEIEKTVKDPQTMTFGQDIDTSLTDKTSWKETAVKNKQLSRDLASEMTQDTYSKINAMFDSGDLGEGINLGFSPRSTMIKLRTLKETDPIRYRKLEVTLERISRIEDDVNRYNLQRRKNLSVEEYIKNREYLAIPQMNFYDNPERLFTIHKENLKMLKELRNDPVTGELMKEISAIGEGLLKKMEKSGLYNAATIQNLKKNRKYFDNFFYKPRIAVDPDETLRQRLKNYALNDARIKADTLSDVNIRGDDAKLSKVKDFTDVFADNFKKTLFRLHNNAMTAKIITFMHKKQMNLINKKLDEVIDLAGNISSDMSKSQLSKAKKDINSVYQDINKMYTVRYIGYQNITDAAQPLSKPKSFFSMLNREKSMSTMDYYLDKEHSQKLGEIAEAANNYKTDKNIVSFIRDGKRYFYKVDPNIKACFNLNPESVNLFSQGLIKMKNLIQSTMTGKYNPAFAVPSSLMSLQESLTVLPVLAQKLSNLQGFSRLKYMSEVGRMMKQLIIDQIDQNFVDNYDRLLIANHGKPVDARDMLFRKRNIDEVRNKLRSSLLTQIRLQGGASLKPYTVNDAKYFRIDGKTPIGEAVEKALIKHHGINGAVQLIKIIDVLQNALREGPTLGLTSYLGKAKNAISADKIKNPKMMQKIIDIVGANTANIGREGTNYGVIGGLGKKIKDYVSYGDIMFKSIAPKIRASGINKGLANLGEMAMDLYDPKVRYLDILRKIQLNSADLVKNKFVQGLVFTSFVPSIISYVWNFGSNANREAYMQHSDYDKTAKFMLMNFFGPNRHLYLPKDQEVALSDTIFTTFLDGILGMSQYNEADPAFKQNRLILKALGRSIGLDSIPALDIIANLSGNDATINLFDIAEGGEFLTPLKRDVINSDLSETAYENGITSQRVHALVNTLFGAVGSTLLGSVEEGNVGSNNDNAINDFSDKLTDGLFRQAKLLTSTKAISSFNSTSKDVYNKRNLLNKIASIKEKSPQQAEIYEFIKIYKRNRIEPIHQQAKDLRKSINTIRSTGRNTDGSILDYEGRRSITKDLTVKLQKIYAKEYKEFKNLDNLIEQKYGKGINLENFMENFNE